MTYITAIAHVSIWPQWLRPDLTSPIDLAFVAVALGVVTLLGINRLVHVYFAVSERWQKNRSGTTARIAQNARTAQADERAAEAAS